MECGQGLCSVVGLVLLQGGCSEGRGRWAGSVCVCVCVCACQQPRLCQLLLPCSLWFPLCCHKGDPFLPLLYQGGCARGSAPHSPWCMQMSVCRCFPLVSHSSMALGLNSSSGKGSVTAAFVLINQTAQLEPSIFFPRLFPLSSFLLSYGARRALFCQTLASHSVCSLVCLLFS